MTAPSEQRLRSELLGLVNLAGRPDAADSRLDILLTLRFPEDESVLSPLVQERHLEALHAKLDARSNGRGRAWGFLRPAGRRRVLWPALAVGAVGVAVILLLLLLGRPRIHERGIVDNRPKKSTVAPEDKPRDPRGPQAQDEQRIVLPDQKRGRKTPLGPQQPIAKVSIGAFGKVQGEPTIRLSGVAKASAALRNGSVFAGATISTGDMDKAEIKFSDGTTVAMDFNTTLILSQQPKGAGKAPPRPSELTVTGGRIVVQAVRATNATSFEVKTPVATARVIGTKFSLALVREKVLKAVLQVEEGKVEFFNTHGSVEAGAKTESTATKDTKPTEPKRIASITIHISTQGDDGLNWGVYNTSLPSCAAVWKTGTPVGWVGLGGQPDSHSQRNHLDGLRQMPSGEIRVNDVYPDSPARKAGLQVGDILESLNGARVRQAEDVLQRIWRGLGRPLRLSIRRNGQRRDVRLVPIAGRYVGTRSGTRVAPALTEASWLLARGKSKDAVRNLLALRGVDSSAAVHNSLGVAYEMQDDVGNAIRSYRRAILAEPGNALYHYNLGVVLRKIGNYRRSVQELQTASELDTRSVYPPVACAQTLFFAGQYDQAVAFLEQCKARLERTREFRLWLALSLARDGRLAEGIASAKRCVSIDPTYRDGYDVLLMLLLEDDRPSEAEIAARKALEIEPLDSSSHNRLGFALNLQRRYIEAEEAYKRAIDISPKYCSAMLNLGKIYEEQRRVDEAIRMYRKAIAIDPLDVENHFYLAALFEKQNRNRESEEILRKAIAVDPTHALSYLVLLRVQWKQGRTREASETLSIVRSMCQTSTHHDDLGKTLRSMGRTEEAIVEFRAAAELDPKWGMPHADLGSVLRKDPKRLKEAESEYRTAIALAPRFATAYTGLAILLAGQNRLREAEPLFRHVTTLDPRSAEGHTNLALLLNRIGRTGEAEAELREAIRLDPGYAIAYNGLGNLYRETGRYREAVEAFKSAVRLAPSDHEYFHSLGNALFKLGRLDEAEDALRTSVRLKPEYAPPHNGLGHILRRRGKLLEAEAEYRKVIELNPSFAGTYVDLADLLDRTDRPELADQLLRDAIKHCPNDADPPNFLAWRFAERGVNLDEALGHAERAVKVAPEDFRARDTLGWVRYKRKEYRLAEVDFKKAAELYGEDPGAAEVWLHLGMTYEALKQPDKAKEAYQKALALDPKYQPAADALKRLEPKP